MRKRGIEINRTVVVTILTLAWPTMLEQLLQTAVQYIDTAMVGSLGTHATAAVGATSTGGWLIGSSVHAFGIGFLSFIAQAYGAKDREAAAKAVMQAVIVTVVCGLTSRRCPWGCPGMCPSGGGWMRISGSWRDDTFSFWTCPCCREPPPSSSARCSGRRAIRKPP